MQTSYKLSQPTIAVGAQTSVDLLAAFRGEMAVSVSRRPLNISLVIDHSGSMAGNPLKYAKQAAKALVSNLTPNDYISIVIYDDSVDTILAPQKMTDRDAIHKLIDGIHAAGCTNLSGGWLKGCDHVKTHMNSEMINRVLLLTDGQANDGITDSDILVNTSRQKAAEGILTTTLGFGTYFNEDLLIGMAHAGNGHFYFIQSFDDAEDVFRIELESLISIAAQNLVVTAKPIGAVEIAGVLNNYKTKSVANGLEITIGDVSTTEDKVLALELLVPACTNMGNTDLIHLSYQYHTVVDGAIQTQSGEMTATIAVDTAEAAAQVVADPQVSEQANRLRIAKVKDEAVSLADKGEYEAASQRLAKTVEDLKVRNPKQTFEFAEELDHLDHYAQKISQRQFTNDIRKEMRDQSYQAQNRGRSDMKLRGVASGSSDSLTTVQQFDQGVIVKCVREGGKLRIHVVSEGYNPDFNVQFPRHLREAGVTYIVDEVKDAGDSGFYRASGNIRRLLMPGETVRSKGGVARKSAPPKASSAPPTVADLETTDTVGTGVLVQCVKDGSKLRARVVSDGYNPNHNMRFPRSIRQEGILYVVEEVMDGPGGTSYIACGKIKRLIQ